jgi:hypothetical protein
LSAISYFGKDAVVSALPCLVSDKLSKWHISFEHHKNRYARKTTDDEEDDLCYMPSDDDFRHYCTGKVRAAPWTS